MKRSELTIGGHYNAKVSGVLVHVRVTDIQENWQGRCVVHCVNERTLRNLKLDVRRLRPLKRIPNTDWR